MGKKCLRFILAIFLVLFVVLVFQLEKVTIKDKWTETASVFTITSSSETYHVELDNGNCYKVSLKDYQFIKKNEVYMVIIDKHELDIVFPLNKN